MAGRIRTIKPEFAQSETIGALSREARLLFILIWTVVDDEGRTRGASRLLASLLYPYDADVPELIEGWLAELEQNKAIRRYEIEGSSYVEIVNWLKHQKIDKPSKSRLPAFVEASRGFANGRAPSSTDLGPSILDHGPVDAAAASSASLSDAVVDKLIGPALFKIFCDAYPPDALGERRAARVAFDKWADAGSDVLNRIIADARRLPADGGIPAAAAWLNAWVKQPQPPSTVAVSKEAITLANRICVIVGHEATLRPPSWMGAAYRVQQWLNQGWAEGIIIASVTEQVARKRGGKIERIEYFEPGIGDAVARANAPVPTGNPQKSRSGDTREASRQKHSVIAAIDRVFEQVARSADHSTGGIEGPNEDAVLRLPPRSVR